MIGGSLARGAPTFPDCIEQPNDKRRCATSTFAERLRRVAEEVRGTDPPGAMIVGRAAWKLARCAHAGKPPRTGWRCGSSYCPRCSRQTAIKYRKRLERWMRSRVADGAAPNGFALLTLTLATPDPISGCRVLCKARARFLRGSLALAVISGGEGHVHAEPARGGEAQVWNVHMHAIVELGQPRGSVDTSALQVMWAQALAHFGARGSLDLRQWGNLTAESLRSCRDEARG
jgi:hypothetical protein